MTGNRDLIRNSTFNFVTHAITAVSAFVAIPVALRQLGPERFGLLSLVWSLLNYSIVFDFGTGPAVSRATAASIVADQGRRIAAIVRAAVVLQVGLGLLAAVAIAALAPALMQWLNVPADLQSDGKRALYVLALTVPVVLFVQTQQAVLEGLERFDLIAYVRAPVAVAGYLLPAAGALAGWSLAGIMASILVSRLVGLGCLYALYQRTLPDQQFGHARAELPGLFRFGRWIALSSLLTQLLAYADRFLLSAMHGLAAVAQYAPPYDAASKLLLLPGSVGVALFPSMTKDVARERGSRAVQRSRRTMWAGSLLLAPICLGLILFARPLLTLWLGPSITSAGIQAFRILVLATFLHGVAYPPLILIEAFGRPDIIARYYVFEAIAYLAIAFYAISRFGVVGAAWAWLARTAVLVLWSTWFTRRWSGPPDETLR